jgi:oxalate decarboxylase
MVTLKPGGLREMHWHPNVSEWQYWIKGKGRVTVASAGANARTMDFNANDVGYIPAMAAHTIENTGTEDVVFLEMFKAPKYEDISFNEWIARMPDKMVEAHLKLPLSIIRRAPQTKTIVLPQ